MLIVFIVSILVGCHGKGLVSFPTAETNSSSVSGALGRKEGPENVQMGKPQSKNLAFVPVVIPVQQPPLPYPVVGWPSQFSSAPSFPTSIVSPANYGPSPMARPAFGSTACSCTSLEACSTRFGTSVITTRIVTNPPPEAACLPGQVYCCMESTKLGCGIPNIIPGLSPVGGQAQLGQFPWAAIILTPDNNYVGGGVLIDATHVLTVAHRLVPFGNGSGLKVRFGEWDLSNENEPVGFLEVGVSRMVHHPQFDASTLRNDVTVITLAKPVSTLTKPFPQINSICMPQPTTAFTGMRCKVAGWGKDQFNGKYQNIMKEVEVPVLSAPDCQSRLRNTQLGPSFVLDAASFICAGGEPGKDACTGDGGNALACLMDGKYYVAGLTAAGIQCGQSNVPGLYVNLVSYVPWINSVIGGTDAIVVNPRGGLITPTIRQSDSFPVRT